MSLQFFQAPTFRKAALSILILFGLSMLPGCGANSQPGNYPKSAEELEDERIGKLTGEEGIVLMGGKKRRSSGDGISVNAYLWRAALDAVHTMPIAIVDPKSGVITTDWYDMNGDQFKLNIFIIGSEMRFDAVRVHVLKRVMKNGKWIEAQDTGDMSADIKDLIVSRASALKAMSKY